VPEPVRIKFELSIQEVPEQAALLVTDQTHVEEIGTVIPRRIDEVRVYIDELGLTASGPPVCVCPFPDDDGVVETEVGWPVQGDAPGRGSIEARTLPAVRALVLKHTGPYAELARSYRLMSEAMERHGLTPVGAPREVYVTDPAVTPGDQETVIVWPIGPEGELEPSGDFFHRRVESD
jgi:effector-binding domain-containing protein